MLCLCLVDGPSHLLAVFSYSVATHYDARSASDDLLHRD